MFNRVHELEEFIKRLGCRVKKCVHTGTAPGVKIENGLGMEKFIPLSCSEDEVERIVKEFMKM
jgi:hypothetical protein